MRRLLSVASRALLAAVLFLMTLAVLRWGPVYAEPPWDVRALPLFGPAVLLAVAAALTGGPRRGRPVRPAVVALALSAAGLAMVVALRGGAGLPAHVSDRQGRFARLPAGAVDVVGPDLAELPRARRRTIAWTGSLRPPMPGRYRLWVQGRGGVQVAVDGRPLLAAWGDPIEAGRDVTLGARHRLQVTLEQVAYGPRLRVGWRRPDGWEEPIPPRYLGRELPAGLWLLTDLLALAVAASVAALSWLVPWDRRRRLPPARPVGAAEVGLSLAGHAALAAVMSWPLVADLAGAGPLHRPDGRLNAWILAWDAHALWNEPGRLFDAPIFHPLPDALAFSENLLLPAAVASPATAWGTPVLGYNLVLLGSLVLSGLGGQLLVRRVTGARLAAFVGGAAFAVGAHRWFRTAHLHAQLTVFLPFALLALDRFYHRPTWRRAGVFGLLLAAQGLASIYLGAITAVAAAVAVALGVVAGWRGRELLKLGMAAALAGVLLAPIAAPYLRMRAFQGQEFTMADQAAYATNLASYAASSTRVYGPLTQRHLGHAEPRDPLLPGLALLVLGIAGLASAPARYRGVAVAVSAVALVLSLGPETAFYRFLHEHVLLFRGIRALSRFSLVIVLALCVLAGLALAQRRRLALPALVLLLLEASHVPLRVASYEPPSAASRWLGGRPGAVAYLPLGPEGDTQAMLDGIAHWRPMLNGDSGFIPRPYDRARELLEGALSADALRFLRAVDVRDLVTRGDCALPLLARFGEERIWAVPPGPAAEAVVPGRPVATLWTPRGALVVLTEPETVGRIAFEISDEPWIARPAVEVSLDGSRWERADARASLADATLSLFRDPRQGLGELRFHARRVLYVRIDDRLPARRGALHVGP